MADVIKYSNAVSDVSRFSKSRTIGTAADGGNRVFVLQVPRKGFVKAVFLEIIQAFTGGSSGTVKVGYKDPDGEDVDFFMTDTEAASEVLGMKTPPEGMQARYFEKGGSITVSLAKGDSAADVKCRVFTDISTIY